MTPQDRFDHLFIAPSNFDRALAFYRDALGWRAVASWGGGNEPRGTVLDGGGIEIVLAERHATNDHSWSGGINGERPTIHLVVENLQDRFHALPSTAQVVVTPEETHWGTRWFVVKDPDGNLIAYEQPLLPRSEP